VEVSEKPPEKSRRSTEKPGRNRRRPTLSHVIAAGLTHAGREASGMTTLGAALYIGFFVAAALWLYLTGDHGQRPDRSNSSSTASAADTSRPCLVSHSSLK